MDRRERMLFGQHGFDWEFKIWIFTISLSFAVERLRSIDRPKWLGLWLCKRGKHDWFLSKWRLPNPEYTCQKCGKIDAE